MHHMIDRELDRKSHIGFFEDYRQPLGVDVRIKGRWRERRLSRILAENVNVADLDDALSPVARQGPLAGDLCPDLEFVVVEGIEIGPHDPPWRVTIRNVQHDDAHLVLSVLRLAGILCPRRAGDDVANDQGAAGSLGIGVAGR
eukprot:6172556-Prymnesium_polylepis.1